MRAGDRGLLFYDPAEPEQGLPLFPTPEQKQLGDQWIGFARQELAFFG